MALTRDQREWIDDLAYPPPRAVLMHMAAGGSQPDWDRHLDSLACNCSSAPAELFVRCNGALMPDSVKRDFYNLLHT